ncbi:unnamed protein product [Hyaloperonospora brassicae]|uniref:FYVE-type domain-containing protein n=1 Tax=Hyaloperonospora brassicae TaxID=162125 RepID=A0AAV0TAM3_HYABA|nr:unnamed protein product [Hyaloperonospora brassicae]
MHDLRSSTATGSTGSSSSSSSGSGSNKELDLTYMPYHEGLMNHNAPPVRGSLSVRVPNAQVQQLQLQQHHHQQQQQQSPFYGDSDDDDDASDDPAWMNAPRGSLQPAFSSSVMKKTASSGSATDSETSSAVSVDTNRTGRATVPDEQQQQQQMSIDDSDKETVDKRSSSEFTSDELVTDAELQQCTTAAVDQTVPVDVAMPTRATKESSKLSDVSVDDLTPAAAAADAPNDRYRESIMRYRPSNFQPQDVKTAMLARDSLAPDTFDVGCNTDAGTRRSATDYRDSSNGLPTTGRTPTRDSVPHVGPRVIEEGLSDYLRAAKAGNLPLLRSCLQDRSTNVAERDAVHGQSALHIAVRFGQLHAVQVLCGKKTRSLLIDAVDNRLNTPLHLAAAKSRRITKYLLEHGADASRVNSRHQTALAVQLITTKRDDPLITEMLLQHKTDPNGALGNSTLLHKAVDLKLFEIAYRLVRHGARLDVKDGHGRTVFDKAEPKVLRQLCSKIAYPPVWIPNDDHKSCMSCLRTFSHIGIGVRRHHCRHCGRLVCGRCSHVSVDHEAFPSTFIGHMDRNMADERSTRKRVCTTCSNVFDERAKQQKDGARDSSGKWSDAFLDRVVGCAWDEIERKSTGNSPGASRPRGSLAA